MLELYPRPLVQRPSPFRAALYSCRPGYPPESAEQTRRYLLKHPDAGWADVPDLPKAAVELLRRDFVKCTSRVVHCQHSADGETSKLLLELQDGLQVEAVIMRYDTTGEGPACALAASLPCDPALPLLCHSFCAIQTHISVVQALSGHTLTVI